MTEEEKQAHVNKCNKSYYTEFFINLTECVNGKTLCEIEVEFEKIILHIKTSQEVSFVIPQMG